VQPRVTLCSVCHSQMPVGQTRCSNCGSTLCPHCRELLPQRSRFCPKCGYLCVAEQQILTPPAVPFASGPPQAMPIPRAATGHTQQAAQVPVPRPSLGGQAAQQHRNCPKCGSSIDLELGRCTGCGLLYGARHRAMQPAPGMPTPSVQRPSASWPQGSTVPQPQRGYNTPPQYNMPTQAVPAPAPWQHQNYMPATAMPQPGMAIPIPRMAPTMPGTVPPSGMAPGAMVPPRPYQYRGAPPPSERRPAPAGKGGLSGFAMAMIVIMCLLVGGGVYYFFIRSEAPPPALNNVDNINNTVSSSALNILNVSVQSTTKTSAIIKWVTDKPATGHVVVKDADGATVTEEKMGTLAKQQSVTIRGLEPGTTYYYTVIATDADGHTATSEEGELVTQATGDETAPVISGVAISNITESGAIITWLTADEPATGQIKYWTSDNATSTTTPEQTDLVTQHSVTLTRLDSGTTYNLTIISRDAAGNESSLTRSFDTLTPIPVGIEVGNRAPDFELKNLSRANVKLSDFIGKTVLLNFWATWCVPCEDELPFIQSVSDNWSSSSQLVVLAIADNNNETLDTVTQFIQGKGYNFGVLYDAAGDVKNLYGIETLPTTFFIDKNGIIQKIQVGSFQDQDSIETILSTMQ
jgi:peroxiredoxin